MLVGEKMKGQVEHRRCCLHLRDLAGDDRYHCELIRLSRLFPDYLLSSGQAKYYVFVAVGYFAELTMSASRVVQVRIFTHDAGQRLSTTAVRNGRV